LDENKGLREKEGEKDKFKGQTKKEGANLKAKKSYK